MRSQKALLFNASNMDTFPVYPYAFIQVPAIARRAGVEVICRDLLGVPQERWEQSLEDLVERHNPTVILITLRTTDSLTAQDYERGGAGSEAKNPYFPVERTKRLIAAIRGVSDLKIAVGGFGFSVLPDEIMHYLRPDFGVFGGPDAFFAHFDALNTGNLETIANLLYFQEGQLIANPRKFYPPLAEAEYTSRSIEEMMAFYEAFPSPGFLGAPVEIMRGCSHACVFCCEPHVAGRQVRYRDLSAVLEDIAILVDHGITRIYMISSELNPEGNAFVIELADRIRAFNARHAEDRKVTWFGANYLLGFSRDEYERLSRSGFTGGWFDVTALDDENARAMRTPYRNKSLVAHLRTYAEFERTRARDVSPPDGPDCEGSASERTRAITWSLFLGNPATTTRTIRNTLRAANKEGLAQLFAGCHVNTNIRVFGYEEPDAALLAGTYSVTPALERTHYEQLLPSFAYPPALMDHFGSEEEIALMFGHVAETYLSTKYERSRDWHSFVKQNGTSASIASWVAELSGAKGVSVPAPLRPGANAAAPDVLQMLFSAEAADDQKITLDKAAQQVVDGLLSACLESFPDLFGSLDLPTTMEELEHLTPYELAVVVYDSWSTEKELAGALAEKTQSILNEPLQELVRFCVQAVLHRLNVVINPKYRELFVSVSLAGTEHG